MKPNTKTLLTSLSIAAAIAAGTATAAQAATDAGGSKFKTFEATPKAPRVEAETPRQIVVEPRREREKTPVAVLTPQVDEADVEPDVDTPQQEAAAKPPGQAKPAEPKAEAEAANPDDLFAPKTATEEKVEMPTVFTEKQQKLFNDLGADEQKALVERLVKKYGYETMYPKTEVTRNYLDDYKTKQSHSNTHEYSYTYAEPVYGTYGSYGAGYNNCQ